MPMKIELYIFILEMVLYMKKIIFMMIYDLIGSVFIGVSIVCFAVAADFAPGGVMELRLWQIIWQTFLLDWRQS